jgi:hypothetical protein
LVATTTATAEVATATAATTEVATTAAAEAAATAATTTAAEAATAATTAAAAAEAATASAAAATAAAAAEATTWTRSTRLSLIHHEGAAFEVFTIEAFDGSRSGFLRTHGHEAEPARAARFAICPDEHIQHLSMRREDFTKPFRSRTIIEIAYKDLEHFWPPGPGHAMYGNKEYMA